MLLKKGPKILEHMRQFPTQNATLSIRAIKLQCSYHHLQRSDDSDGWSKVCKNQLEPHGVELCVFGKILKVLFSYRVFLQAFLMQQFINKHRKQHLYQFFFLPQKISLSESARVSPKLPNKKHGSSIQCE